MAIPDPHFFSRTERTATNRAGGHAGVGGLRREMGCCSPEERRSAVPARGWAGATGPGQWAHPEKDAYGVWAAHNAPEPALLGGAPPA